MLQPLTTFAAGIATARYAKSFVRIVSVVMLAVPMASACSDGTSTIRVPLGLQERPAAPGLELVWLPDEIIIHPGDQLELAVLGDQDRHALALGQLVDAAYNTPPSEETVSPGQRPSAFEALPRMFSVDGFDIDERASDRCSAEDELPASGRCPDRAPMAYDGTPALLGSGLITSDDAFTFTFDDTIADGTYHLLCLLHGPAMASRIVVDRNGERTTQEAVDAAHARAVLEAAGRLDPIYDDSNRGKIVGNYAGFGFGLNRTSSGINEFMPAHIDVAVDTPIYWTIYGTHTITFGQGAAGEQALVVDPEGGVSWNAEVSRAVGGNGAPRGDRGEVTEPDFEGISFDPIRPGTFVVDGGSWDGVGAKSSGLLASFLPKPIAYSISFNRPGDYEYTCLVHPGMQGIVHVRAAA